MNGPVAIGSPQKPPCFNWLLRLTLFTMQNVHPSNRFRITDFFRDKPVLSSSPDASRLLLIRLRAEFHFCWYRSPNISEDHEPFFVENPLSLNLEKNPKISLDSSMRRLLYHHKKESLPP